MLEKPTILLLFFVFLIAGFFIFVPLTKAESAPPAINYAPNFWFDSQEQYYPVNPLDFYFENGIEINGEIAVNKYNQLSLETKLENITVLYHILDYGNQWVYQYWLFYIFNDSLGKVKNKHYGDWEAVFVFVDKNSGQVVKAIGTAHQKRIFDTEIYQPENKHIWTYVGNGSHANCLDEKDDGYCDLFKWRFLEKWDKNGHKILYDNYTLKEITFDFIKIFKEITTFEKSSELGINIFDFLKIKKEFYVPWGGSPPTHAWAQSNYYNPEELRPIGFKYALDKINQASNKIAGFFDNLVAGVGNFFRGLGGGQEAGISQTFLASEKYSPEPVSKPAFEIKEPELPLSGTTNLGPEIKAVKGGPIVQEAPEIDSLPEITFSEGEPGSGPDKTDKQPIEKEWSEEESKKGESPIKPPPFISGGGTPSPPAREEMAEEEMGSGEGESEEGESEEATTTPLLPPKIISPQSGNIFGQADDYVTSTPAFEINLIGTSTPSYNVLVFVNSTSTNPNYSTTTDNNGDWSQIIILKEGENTIRAKAEDSDNNESQEVSLNLIVDTIPPSKITDLSAHSGTSRNTIDLSWTAPGADEYIVRYATSSEITTSTWPTAINIDNEPIPALASSTENLTVGDLEAGQTYYWAIRSKDKADNLSEISNCASSSPLAKVKSLVISEIAVQRGSNRAKDEFIELYNPTDNSINLAGWSLQYTSAQATSTWQYKYFWVDGNSSGNLPDFNLPSHAYYLLTSATSSDYYSYGMQPDLAAVTIAGNPTYLGLAADGGKIRLLNDKEEIIDLVAWGKDSLGAEGEPVNIDSFSWGSLERKAGATSTPELLARGGVHHWLGNGWDTDNNSQDFVLQTQPNPQNSLSLTEPETAFPVLADTPWPMLHHDLQHTGRSSYTGSATGAPTSTPKWIANLDSINPSSPVIGSDGEIYIGTSSGRLYKVSPDSSFDTFCNQDSGVFQTPALASNGVIYVAYDNAPYGSYLYALSPNGHLIWKYLISSSPSDPVIAPNGNIYIGSKYYLYALNPDGELIWRNPELSNGRWVTSVTIDNQGNIYANGQTGDSAKAYKLNPSSGEIIASSSPRLLSNAPSSLGEQGNLYVSAGGGYHGGWGLSILDSGNLKEKHFVSNIGKLVSTPAVGSNGIIYIGSQDYQLYAVNSEGVSQWPYNTVNTQDKINASPVVDAAGTIYIGSNSKNFYAINPDGTVKWQAELSDKITSSAAIGPDGTIYVTSIDGLLYAFGK